MKLAESKCYEAIGWIDDVKLILGKAMQQKEVEMQNEENSRAVKMMAARTV